MTVNRYEEDELPLRGRTGRRADPDPADREISLGTITILGIFFLLALICAGFFGFGYVLGRRSVDTAAAIPTGSIPALAVSSTAKPSAGLPGQAIVPAAQPATGVAPSTPIAHTETVSLAPPSTQRNVVIPADGMVVGDRSPAPQPTAGAATYVVQVAAVSTQDIADIEVAALKKQGFDVAVRHEPQDKLLHIQIGPFADRKQAEAMRANVLAHGFNAIVK